MNRLQRTAARVFGIETRDSSYTDALVAAITANASGETTAFPTATAALEACAGLVARAFAGASVSASAAVEDVLTPAFLEMVGRSLIRKGELVVYITTRNGELLLLPAESHDVDGDPDPASWTYRLTIGGPSRSHTLDSVSAASVLHFKYGTDPEKPWRGLGPLQVAQLGGRLSAELASALADEASGPRGSLLPVPIEGGDGTLAQLRADLGKLKGKAALVQAGDWGNPGGSNMTDWSTRRLGPNTPLALVELHRLATEEVAAACGVNPGMLSGRQQTVAREGYQTTALRDRRPPRTARGIRTLGQVGGRYRDLLGRTPSWRYHRQGSGVPKPRRCWHGHRPRRFAKRVAHTRGEVIHAVAVVESPMSGTPRG